MITYNGSDLILAPIAGYSDAGMRTLCFRYGAGLCYTEMVSAKGLFYGNENTEALLHIDPEDKFTGAQLFGSEPDIFADDVKCSHGATSGDLDAEQLFYMQSRGIPLATARRILIDAYLDEVCAKVADSSIAEWLKTGLR